MREEIIEHYESPYHCGDCEGSTHRATRMNPSCGDDVTMALRVEEGRIVEAWHKAHGCVLSCASASMLCAEIEGKAVDELPRLIDWLARLPIHTPKKRRCVALAHEALMEAMKGNA